ncbi:right-handed parallel beta-helix repeat-containing protein [Algibacter pectinivorans]|uniref:Parallel beta-helix repeat (Two copies) n=1 Tax=Algibacter pectinivorans TaxID=870482 RepID=A0A1I1PIS8_9FLAO|nr:right-handed parallel beta-helix repeat-containing protein [Algibacter pectinivorans]SFD07568.1 parallel beta-helix repeat (two copies) [Algibacter pectinivorans]
MKITIKNIALAMATVVTLTSCNNEELFVDQIVTEELVETDNIKEEVEDPVVDPTAPCAFSLSSATANSTVVIDCILDLDGQTITLPSSVYLSYAGGDIINGTINFGASNTIDGELLNYTLNVKGQTPKLTKPEFNFLPERWDIVEGETTSDIAWDNNKNLEFTMSLIKELGATTFKMDVIDAYFEGSRNAPGTNFYPSVEAVNIPSDFNLVMTDNTHLRIQPATAQSERLENGAIFAIRDADNITVTGGNLHGDRKVRYFSPDNNGLEGAHLFYIESGRNVILDGIKFIDGSKGGLNIYSLGATFEAWYNPSRYIKVLNCEFTNIRRMAVALTDGRDILFEGNTFTNTGQPGPNSTGGEVGYAMNMEATRVRDANGILVEREKVTDIIIRGNKETGSRGGSISVHIGQNVTIEDNDFETTVTYAYTNGTKIINNRFKGLGASKSDYAIFATGDGDTVYNNEIYGNTIEDYNIGMILSSAYIEVHSNVISGVTSGILLGKSTNSNIYNNNVTANTFGIIVGNTWLNNVEIKGNTLSAGFLNMKFSNSNNKPEHANYTFSVTDNICKTDKKIDFLQVNGVNFSNNEVAGIQIANSTNLTISNNTIKPTDFDGIRLYDDHDNVSLINNTIYEPTGASRFQCINNGSESQDEIIEKGNTCN